MSTATLNLKLVRPGIGIRRILVTCVLAVLAGIAMTSDSISQLLQFDRGAIADLQGWRIITGHLVHWDASHFVWDAAMFVVLGVLCERRSRGRFLFCLCVSAVAISACVYWFLPEMVYYRGLSGIDTALFTLAVGLLLREAWRNGDRLMIGLLIAGLVGLVGKLAFEITTGTTLFVDSSAAGFTPLPLVHAVGAVVGMVSVIRAER